MRRQAKTRRQAKRSPLWGILSLVMALMLAFGMVPASAFAAGGSQTGGHEAATSILNSSQALDTPYALTVPTGADVKVFKQLNNYNLELQAPYSSEDKGDGTKVFRNTPVYNSAYIRGIANLYEFDTGDLSGWMYCVNGWYPNYGCSRYAVQQGDVIEWHYTCDLGRDLGVDWVG